MVANTFSSFPRSLAARFLFLVLVAATLVRGYLAYEATWPPFSDSRDYHVLAKNMLDGEGYVQRYHGENKTHEGFTFHAYRMPGYPVVLSLIYSAFGFDPSYAYVANVLFDLLALILFARVAHTLLGMYGSVIATTVLALNVYWSVLLTTESLFNLCVIAVLYWIVVRMRDASFLENLLFSMVLACAVFVRPVALLLYPAVVWRLLSNAGNTHYARPVHLALVLVPLMALLSSWTARNYLMLHHPVVLSTNFGWHNAASFGIDRVAVFNALRHTNEATINKELTSAIIQRVATEPIMGMRIFGERFFSMFSLAPPHEISQFVFKRTFATSISELLELWWFHFYVVYFVAGIGCIAAVIKRESGVVRIILVGLVTIACHGFMSDGSFRFFAPWYPLVALCAAFGVQSIVHKRHT